MIGIFRGLPHRLVIRIGANDWWAVVVTFIVVLIPAATDEGFAVQLAAAAGREQLKVTFPLNPSVADT